MQTSCSCCVILARREAIVPPYRPLPYLAADLRSIPLSADAQADIQRLFESAADHAALAGRQQPHAGDALASQDEALAAKRLKRESKQRRAGMCYLI